MIELIVTVWGKDHTLRVYRKSKSVWIAIGDCSGAQFSVKGRTEGSSMKALDRCSALQGATSLSLRR
jgi:hypothetical protein